MKKIIKSLSVLTLCGASATNITACHVIKKGEKTFSPEQPTEAPEPTTEPPQAPKPPQAPMPQPQPPVPQVPPKPTSVPQQPPVIPKPTEVPPKPQEAPQVPPVPEVAEIRLNEQVAKDLRLINENSESLVEVGINFDMFDSAKWDFIEPYSLFPYYIHSIRDITALVLLKNDDTAISPASEDFLINTLQLTKDEDNKFNRYDARNITVLISEIKPTLSKKADGSDYIVTGGTFKLQFVKGDVNLGNNYTIDLKGNELDISSTLNKFWFSNIDFQIPNFKVGADNKKPTNGDDLYKDLNKESDVYKKLESLKLLINTGDKISIIVTKFLIPNSYVWKHNTNNLLKLKIHFGTIISSNEVNFLFPPL